MTTSLLLTTVNKKYFRNTLVRVAFLATTRNKPIFILYVYLYQNMYLQNIQNLVFQDVEKYVQIQKVQFSNCSIRLILQLYVPTKQKSDTRCQSWCSRDLDLECIDVCVVGVATCCARNMPQ